MDDIAIYSSQLPDTIPDLAKFVLVGREQLNAVRAQIRAIDRIGIAQGVHEQKLLEAQEIAEAVLDAEMKLGELLAAIPAMKGKRTDLEPMDSAVHKSSKKDVLAQSGISVRQAQRYETLAAHPEIVAKAKADAREAGDIISRTAVLETITKGKPPYIVHNSGTEEWYTPRFIVDAARTVMGGIDLDPASCAHANDTVKASVYYTREDDGLSKDWSGRVFLNPPYSYVSNFIEKLLTSSIDQAVVITNNATETQWCRRLTESASAVVFLTGRTEFTRQDGEIGKPMQGQAVFYVGSNVNAFLAEFSPFGWGCRINHN